MTILLVNDDGIDAVGIRCLVAALSGEHTLRVIARTGSAAQRACP